MFNGVFITESAKIDLIRKRDSVLNKISFSWNDERQQSYYVYKKQME